MNYPRVRFRLNKNLDKKTAIDFLGFTYGGINFANGILNVHPEIKKSIFNYIDNFYKKKGRFLKRLANNFERKWRSREREFFETASKIFKNHPWPKGKYIGYISIFDCNPRFLENKTFQIFYKHKAGPVYVTAHELLHFVFYDYLTKKRKDLKRKLSDDNLWHLSEIINEIMLSSLPLKTILSIKTRINGYPEFQNHVFYIKNKIRKATDIDKVLNIAINTLKA